MDTLIERKKRFTPKQIYGGTGVLFILVLILYISMTFETDVSGFTAILFILYMLVTLIPHLAVLVRRLHDTNQSGWFYFMLFQQIVDAQFMQNLRRKVE